MSSYSQRETLLKLKKSLTLRSLEPPSGREQTPPSGIDSSYICHVAAFFNDGFKDCAHLVDCVADCVYHTTAGYVPEHIIIPRFTRGRLPLSDVLELATV